MVLPPVLRYTLARRMVIIGTGLIGFAGLKHTVCFFSTITISLTAMISQVG